MVDVTTNNKRIVKNTLYLYIRMFITMLVGFYTSRIVLNTLGVSDFGIYNVMGGIIAMLNYVRSLISGGTSRFLTISIGKNDLALMRKTFSTSIVLCIISAFAVFILGETIGLWFMNTQLNIPVERMYAANWVYQCALLSACVVVIQSPYSAAVLAHEHMNIYAYFSILDVFLKLSIVYVLWYLDWDKLILYALLLLASNMIVFVIHVVYCRKNFSECVFLLSLDRLLTKEMLKFSGWGIIGSMAHLLKDNGVNIVLNIFFGTTINAARGIAVQVSSVINNFYSNFQMAASPQIYKYYAQGEIQLMSRLICNSALFCSLLLLCLMVPVMVNIDGMLFLWLGQNPVYTSEFVWLMLLQVLFTAIDLPVGQGITAVGRMKIPALLTASIYFAIFPLTILFIKLGAGPTISNIVFMGLTPVILGLDLWVLWKYTGFDWRYFMKHVVCRIILLLVISLSISYGISIILPLHGFIKTLLSCLLSFGVVTIVVWNFGLNSEIRTRVLTKINQKLNRRLS